MYTSSDATLFPHCYGSIQHPEQNCAVVGKTHTPDTPNMELFDLPCELFRLILEYLLVPDLGKLDIAIVNHELRFTYLSNLNGLILPRYRFSSEGIMGMSRYDQLISWLMKRNIIILRVILSSLDCRSSYCYNLNSQPRIQSLRLEYHPNECLSHIGNCPSLTELAYVGFHFYRSLSFFEENPQITRFTLSVRDRIWAVSLAHIFELCPNVTSLDLSNNQWLGDESVSVLVNSNLNLISLSLGETAIREDASVRLILNSFPNLQYLSFANCDISKDMIHLCFEKVILPSLICHCDDLLLNGLRGLVATTSEKRNVITFLYFALFIIHSGERLCLMNISPQVLCRILFNISCILMR